MTTIWEVAREMFLHQREHLFLSARHSMSSQELIRQLYRQEPKLLAVVENLTLRKHVLSNEWELFVQYAGEVDGKDVRCLWSLSELESFLVEAADARVERLPLVFPKGLQKQVEAALMQMNNSQRFLTRCYRITQLHSKTEQYGDFACIYVDMNCICQTEQVTVLRERVVAAANEIAALCRRAGAEDWRRAICAVKYCVDHWTYSFDQGEMSYHATGPLLHGRGVCMGFALAICEIFSRLSIPVKYVTGQRDGNGHAWNRVYIKGGWFDLDVTDAIAARDPLYHWGMTEPVGRTLDEPCREPLVCNCDAAFVRRNAGDLLHPRREKRSPHEMAEWVLRALHPDTPGTVIHRGDSIVWEPDTDHRR